MLQVGIFLLSFVHKGINAQKESKKDIVRHRKVKVAFGVTNNGRGGKRAKEQKRGKKKQNLGVGQLPYGMHNNTCHHPPYPLPSYLILTLTSLRLLLCHVFDFVN